MDLQAADVNLRAADVSIQAQMVQVQAAMEQIQTAQRTERATKLALQMNFEKTQPTSRVS